MFVQGRGVAQSDVEAARWFSKAADQGDAQAQYNLGVSFEQGRGVAQSDVKAVRWYRKANDQGHADAQYNLGTMLAICTAAYSTVQSAGHGQVKLILSL